MPVLRPGVWFWLVALAALAVCHGVCHGRIACVIYCMYGWCVGAQYEGAACERSVCPNDCSGHGTCEFIEEYSTMTLADWDCEF